MVFAKLINPTSRKVSLVLVEHIHDIVWTIIRLHKNVSTKLIRELPQFENSKTDVDKNLTDNNKNQLVNIDPGSENRKSNTLLSGVLIQSGCSSNLSSILFSSLKRACQLNIESLTKTPTTHAVSLCLSAPQNDLQKQQEYQTQPKAKPGNHVLPVGSTQQDHNPASLTLSGVDQYIKRKYYETLYITKTPITYFAKSTLSRARIVCKIDIKITKDKLEALPLDEKKELNKGINVLISALASLVLSLRDLDLKYNRENFTQSLVAIVSSANSKNFDAEKSQLDIILGSSSNTNYVSTGAYSNLEYKYLKQWTTVKSQKYPELFRDLSNSNSYSLLSSSLRSKSDMHPDTSNDYQPNFASIHSLTENLKVREIELQLILLLEILSLQRIQSQLCLDCTSLTSQSLSRAKSDTQKKKPTKRKLAIGPTARRLKMKNAESKNHTFKRPAIGLSYVDSDSDDNGNGENDDYKETENKQPASEFEVLYPLGTITTSQDTKLDLDIHSDLLFDRLCIWQAASKLDMGRGNAGSSFKANSTSSNAKNKKNEISVLGKTPAQIAAELDKAQEFCREVVLPFFNARLHDKCKSFIRTAKGISGRTTHHSINDGVSAARGSSKRLSDHNMSFYNDQNSFAGTSFFEAGLDSIIETSNSNQILPASLLSSAAHKDDSLLSTLQNDTSMVMRPGHRLASRSNTILSNNAARSDSARRKSSSVFSLPGSNSNASSPGFDNNSFCETRGNEGNNSFLAKANDSFSVSTTVMTSNFRAGLSMTSKQLSETGNQFSMSKRSASGKLSTKKKESSSSASKTQSFGLLPTGKSTSQQQHAVKQKKFGATLSSSLSHTLTRAKKNRHSMPTVPNSSFSSTIDVIKTSNGTRNIRASGESNSNFNGSFNHHSSQAHQSLSLPQQYPDSQHVTKSSKQAQNISISKTKNTVSNVDSSNVIIDETPKKRKRAGYNDDYDMGIGNFTMLEDFFLNAKEDHFGDGFEPRKLESFSPNPSSSTFNSRKSAHRTQLGEDNELNVIIEGTPQKRRQVNTQQNQYYGGLAQENNGKFNTLSNPYNEGYNQFNDPLSPNNNNYENGISQQEQHTGFFEDSGFTGLTSFDKRMLMSNHQNQQANKAAKKIIHNHNNNNHGNDGPNNYNEPAQRTRTVYGTRPALHRNHQDYGDGGKKEEDKGYNKHKLSTPQRKKRKAELEAELGFTLP